MNKYEYRLLVPTSVSQQLSQWYIFSTKPSYKEYSLLQLIHILRKNKNWFHFTGVPNQIILGPINNVVTTSMIFVQHICIDYGVIFVHTRGKASLYATNPTSFNSFKSPIYLGLDLPLSNYITPFNVVAVKYRTLCWVRTHREQDNSLSRTY